MGYPQFFPKARVNLAIAPAGSIPIEGSGLIRFPSVPPRRIRYTSNGMLVADTFEVEIDENLFPLDPRDVLAVSVDIHLGDTGGLGIQLDTISDRNRLILGQTDELSKSIQVGSASTVTLTGRDYAGLLLDEKWQGRTLELGRKLSELVEEVKESVPAFAGRMDVVLAEEDFDPVVPSGRGRKRKKFRAQPDKPIWEVLIDLGMKVGAVVTVDRDQIVIQPPRSIIAEIEGARSPLFVEGRNLRDLKIKRKLGKADTPNVLVQSIDPASGRLVEGRYPVNWKAAARATRIKERAKKTTNVEFRRFVVRHPSPSVSALNAVAEQVYNFHAQEQIEISFTSLDMAIAPSPIPSEIGARLELSRESELVATTQLRNGSPLRIRVEKDARNILEKAVSQADKERQLRTIGYHQDVAAILARGYRLFDELFFVDTASHEYSTDSGYKLDVTAINFIEVDA
jgi:hypothetical protein